MHSSLFISFYFYFFTLFPSQNWWNPQFCGPAGWNMVHIIVYSAEWQQTITFEWLTSFTTATKMYQTGTAGFMCVNTMFMLTSGLYRSSDWATSPNREVIVQLVSLQLLFIRGGQGWRLLFECSHCWSVLHVDDCNEQKVALADNCQRTRVSPLTSIIPPADQFTPLCPFLSSSLPPFSFFFLSPIFLLPCNYSLSAVVNLAPPLPYLSGWAEQGSLE